MTPRDVQILQLIADGYEYEEIAPKVGIRLGTLSNRAGKVFAKLGAYNRPQAVAEAFRKGLIR